jgi:hypothetical protein
MVEALKNGKKVQTERPVTVEIQDWHVPEKAREHQFFKGIRMLLNVIFGEQRYKFEVPPIPASIVRTSD